MSLQNEQGMSVGQGEGVSALVSDCYRLVHCPNLTLRAMPLSDPLQLHQVFVNQCL